MTQEWAVGVIVAMAAVYVLWRWLPAGLRRRLGRVHPAMGKAAGCGGCSSCDGCGSAGGKAAAAPELLKGAGTPDGTRTMMMPKRSRSRT